jgi:hypothetical protein
MSGLLKKLEAEKRWSELELFARASREERPALIREMCGRAVKAEDDEGALRMLILLSMAIEDVEGAKPFEAWVRAAIELWRLTPACKESSKVETGKLPVLIKYKTALIEDVIQRWRKTDSESEADLLLDVIVEMVKRQDPGLMEVMVDLLKKTPNDQPCAHRNRVVRGVLRLSAEQRCRGARDLAQGLWISVARTFSRQDLAGISGVLQWLPPNHPEGSSLDEVDSAPLFEAVAQAAKTYRKAHEAVCELRRSIRVGTSLSAIVTFAPSYLPNGLTEISIGLSLGDRAEQEAAFQKIAVEIHCHVLGWHIPRKKDVRSVTLRVFCYAQSGGPELLRVFELV